MLRRNTHIEEDIFHFELEDEPSKQSSNLNSPIIEEKTNSPIPAAQQAISNNSSLQASPNQVIENIQFETKEIHTPTRGMVIEVYRRKLSPDNSREKSEFITRFWSPDRIKTLTPLPDNCIREEGFNSPTPK